MRSEHQIATDMAILHASCLEQSFLGSLGIPFLTLLYTAMLNDKKSVVVFEYDGDRLKGFVSGGLGLRSIYWRLIQQPIKLTWSLRSALLSLTHARGVVDILVLSVKRGLKNSTNNLAEPNAELYTIAVEPGYRGTGLSETLYRILGSKLSEMGETSFKILVGTELRRAHAFYSKMGAQKLSEIKIHSADAVIYKQKL